VAPVQPTRGDGYPQLGDQLLDAAIDAECRLDPQPLQGSHLGLGIGGIAKAFHQGQVAIIWLASYRQASRLQVGRRHGAGRQKHIRWPCQVALSRWQK